MTIITVFLFFTLVFCSATNYGGVKCADENGQCSCNGLVRYGADGAFSHWVDVSVSISCNNGVFGDPISGTAKACYCKDRRIGEKCADENGQCSCNGLVRYGADGAFSDWHEVFGSIDCKNSVFGDPLFGEAKACYCEQTGFLAHESGYCVTTTGADQNSGVSKASSSLNINNADDCLLWCANEADLTGCEYIWGSSNAGCYAHRSEVSHGNGISQHTCWIYVGSFDATYFLGSPGDSCDSMSVITNLAECRLAIEAIGITSVGEWTTPGSTYGYGCSIKHTQDNMLHFNTDTNGVMRSSETPVCKNQGCSNNDAQAITMLANNGQTISGCADIESMCGMNPTLDSTCCETCGGTSDGPAGQWSNWFNKDSPNASADNESRESHGAICADDMVPLDAECRVVGAHTHWRNTGQNFHRPCGVDGLICKNNENSGNCQNYEVRYLCAIIGLPDYNADGIPDMPCSSKSDCDTMVAAVDQLAEAFEGITMRCYQSLCVPGGDAKVEGESCMANKQCWQPGITCIPIGATFGNAMECQEPRGQYGFCFDDNDCSGSLECASAQCSEPGLLGDFACIGGWCVTETSVGKKAINAYSSLNVFSWASWLYIFALIGFFSMIYTVGKNCFLVNEYVHITEAEV